MGLDAVCNPVLEPVQSSERIACGHMAHECLYGKGRCKRCQGKEPWKLPLHASEVFLSRHSFPEMQNLVKTVGVQIPFSMEVLGCKPVCTENLLYRRASHTL